MPQDSSLPEFWNVRYAKGFTPWDSAECPSYLISFIAQLPSTITRILVPGCGSATDVRAMLHNGLQVDAIDFSEEAIQHAKRVLGADSSVLRQADFFALDERDDYDWVYERAFLCALPRTLWPNYAAKMASLVRPGGIVAGFFFVADTVKGPPFGISLAQLDALLSPYFSLEASCPMESVLPLFQGREYWQVWRKLSDSGLSGRE